MGPEWIFAVLTEVQIVVPVELESAVIVGLKLRNLMFLCLREIIH
jgi:hypothetical protein